MQSALKLYQDVSVESGIAEASPHRLVAMLLSGAIEYINKARIAIANQQIAEKGENVSRAIAIIDNLRASLDRQNGGDLSTNLEALYDYAETRLLAGNMESDESVLAEVAGLLKQILDGWEEIPEEARGE